MSTIIAIVAALGAFGSGIILFFVIEPPILALIFLASAAIAIGCFAIACIAAFLEQ